MEVMRIAILLVWSAVLGPGTATAPASASHSGDLTAAQRQAIDRFVNHAMARTGVVPGLSLAVVVGDSIAYEQGYGLADVGGGRAVTARTVFYTASLAKAFTGMTAAVLAAQGRLDLDAPLTTFFPGLTADAPVHGDHVRVRDLLRHDKGFTNGTVNFLTTFVGPMDDASLVRALNEYSSPAEGFTYSNTNYALAADVIERAAGRSWRAVMRDVVFAPLDMGASTAWVSRVDTADFARPYRATAGGFTPVEFPKTDGTITGAGGIFSSAHDLAAFVIANLHGGRYHGRQALPSAAVREAHAPQVELDATFFEFHRYAYGLGFYLARWDGDLLVHHFGGYPGYRSHLSFMPAHDMGVVVLQNEGNDGNRFADIVAAYVYDLLLGRDAEARGAARLDSLEASVARARARRAPWVTEVARLHAQPQPPALPLAAYAGTYRSERLGPMRLRVSGDRLRVEMGDLHGDVLPAGGNVFVVDWIMNWISSGPARFEFSASDGRVTGLDWGGRPFARQ